MAEKENHQSPDNGPAHPVIPYVINDPLALNLAWMPFVKNGGLFVASMDRYTLGEMVWLELTLPNRTDPIRVEGKIVWITPHNALHHVLPGIGVQFVGANAGTARSQIELLLDMSVDVGGYTYGITDRGAGKMGP